MPTYDYICEVCGKPGRRWGPEGHPPRFCSRKCMAKGDVYRGPPKWPVSPELHEKIKKLYQTKVDMANVPAIQEFANQVGYPFWKIKRYAHNQGWAVRHKKEPNWCKKELEILQLSAHCSLETIQRHLERSGFKRTVTGIMLKRKRMRCLKNKNGQSAHEVSMCFGVDVHTVSRWIRLGMLKAVKRGTKRTPQQGGDIYFIRDIWIQNFIIEHIAEIDIRKVDKFWFVDLLAGGKMGLGPLSVVKTENEKEEEERRCLNEIHAT